VSPWGAALLCCAACSRSAPLAACDDDLRGAWRDEAGARWVILDHGATLEVYPAFDDATPAGAPPELEIAPRVIDLARDGRDVRGTVKRRYMRAAEACVARATARLTACAGSTLDIVLADPVAPLSFGPCTWGTAAPSHRERWHHE
jgi:hypothetical protein